MGMRNITATLPNLIDSGNYIQSGIGISKWSDNCIRMERISMLDCLNANHSVLESIRKELRRPQGRSMDEKEQIETTSGEDCDFLGRRGEKGEQLFKECLLNIGLAEQSIQEIID
ncbi:MAG: hypothetical protein EZS28_003046 [Streblomastix strix]|uniref:Uncharacterized protein n=1 Tax=Streblomastix strix TaxID=222440 RepID=A0A5J4X254_9EUKA|nr:MAG: hypothetical protein EZS28_003046 [Streblomastix strix]